MVKLDVTLLRYLSSEDFKVLTAVEVGMRNHELVPGPLVNSIASLKFGGCGKILIDLTKQKLLAYERGKRYDGYRLTYAGYDYLALNTFTHRNVISGIGNQIGVGKESDVFVCGYTDEDEDKQYAIKFHRLGRVCFRKVSEKRDFYTKSHNKTSWIYLSRKAAQREFEFLKFMYSKGMPVPKPIDCNRHVVIMELIDGRILNQYTLESFEPEVRDARIAKLYKNLMDLILRFANETRVVHGDFNEFNILIHETGDDIEPVIIDLPQVIGVDHELAPEQFERDVDCIVDFFKKRFHYESDFVPQWSEVKEQVKVGEYQDHQDDVEGHQDQAVDEEDQRHQEDDEDQDHVDECATALSEMSVRRRLQSQLQKKETTYKKKAAAKPKNIKSDANQVRRRKKTNQYVICQDTAAFLDG